MAFFSLLGESTPDARWALKQKRIIIKLKPKFNLLLFVADSLYTSCVTDLRANKWNKN